MERVLGSEPETLQRDIRCQHCNLLLARSAAKGQIEVRWKELVVTVVGGRTTIKCRRCGTVCQA